MKKEDLIELINLFDRESWKFDNTSELDTAIFYIYSYKKIVKDANESELKTLYDQLKSLFGIVRLKYGFESKIINSIPELSNLQEKIKNIHINDDNITNLYHDVYNSYIQYINTITNLDFIKNNHENKHGEESLYLAVESLKSLVTEEEYRKYLDPDKMNNFVIDCFKLNNNNTALPFVEQKYKEITKKIWSNSLSSEVDKKEFRILYSNMAGGNLEERFKNLINRPSQSSCSMISSNFIATYGSSNRRMGLIYPSDSNIIMTSAHDLNSNVWGTGLRNKEKGTILSTPKVIEKIGIERTLKESQDLYNSNCYNEIIVDSKPCGIVFLSLGENDVNIDYYKIKDISLKYNLPLYYIDVSIYKDKLSEKDKDYICYHALMNYLELSVEDITQEEFKHYELLNLIKIHKEKIIELFLELKQNGNLNKMNMCSLMESSLQLPRNYNFHK